MLVAVALVGAAVTAVPATAAAHTDEGYLFPGNLLVSRSVYEGDASTVVAGKTVLPPGCTTGCAVANSDGTYPGVWNNDLVDGNFGITAPIFVDQETTSGHVLSTLPVSDSRGQQLVTSFSSKSELALNLSTDGRAVTFMGYAAPVDAIDVSNSNTPGAIDPTNPVPGAYYRAVGQLNARGDLDVTKTNAYSGNNGRAAVLNSKADVYYTAGNGGNGGNPQPASIITGTGAQLVKPGSRPAATTPLGSFSVTQLGDKADKIGKDDNFRGLTVYDNVVYFTKGSGGNGVNTVYFLDTTGTACPSGVGVPAPNAKLPTKPLSYDPSTVQANGLPSNMCILSGFPTTLKSTTSFPFGMWFANDDTLYVADEGNGDTTYSATTGTYPVAAAQTTAGLQKWIRSGNTWHLAYTLSAGLNLGTPYRIRNYPTGVNAATGLPWAPATDGLRNITGLVNRDGSVTVWALTSTVSGDGDQGADPNRLVAVTDNPKSTTAGTEHFNTVRTAKSGEVLRGVSFTPNGFCR